jgi:Cof subfamily protein (haloacid dehalogenase superfamily)
VSDRSTSELVPFALPLRPGGGRALRRPSLVASDLDGTLLPDDGVFPGALGASVAALRDAGVPFVVCTGRMLASARQVVADLGLRDGPIVCYQGALVADLSTGEWLLHRPLPPAEAAAVVRFAHACKRHINAFIDDRLFADQNDEWARRYAAFARVECTFVADLAELVARQAPSKLLITADSEDVERILPEMQHRWRDTLYVTRSLRHHIEINRAGANKSAALEFLCELMGATSERTVACGDSFNDIDMLTWASLGVAMAEGPGEVLAAADLVVPRAELGLLFEQLAAAR